MNKEKYNFRVIDNEVMKLVKVEDEITNFYKYIYKDQLEGFLDAVRKALTEDFEVSLAPNCLVHICPEYDQCCNGETVEAAFKELLGRIFTSYLTGAFDDIQAKLDPIQKQLDKFYDEDTDESIEYYFDQ